MRNKLLLTLTLSLALVVLAAAFSLRANGWSVVTAPSSVPGQIGYQGHLSDETGQPISGTVALSFGLYATATGGAPLWEETQAGVPVANGYFAVALGSVNPLSASAFNAPTRFLEVRIDAGDGQVTLPRQPLASVPYALQAEAALQADLAITATQASWAGLTGVPPGFADGVDDGAAFGVGNQLELVSDTLHVVEGHGSDLDADLLDGQEGDYYRDWNNLTNAPNQPPVAILQADPAVLYLGEGGQARSLLNLGLSYDPEGGPLIYTFDPTGRGNGLPTDFQGLYVTGAYFARPGDYLAAGWVQDSDGAVSRAQALLSVYRFGSTIVHSAASVDGFSSLAEVDGRPAIAFYSNANHDLVYVRANDASGASWGTPITVDSTGDVGMYASLAVVNGRPAIAYYDAQPNGDLKYVRANDAAGTLWGTPITVDLFGDVGAYTSMAVVGGRPAIAYYDATSTVLKYVRAGDANGTTWGTAVRADDYGFVGQMASLAVVDGRPAIAYYDSANSELQYVRAEDDTGGAWGTPLIVDGTASSGLEACLVVVDGRAAIAYIGGPNDTLRYVRANDPGGDTWGTPLTVDATPSTGWWTSMAVVDGHPAIAYFESGAAADLKYIRAEDASGAGWGTPLIIDSGSAVGVFASLAVVDGRPAVAHFDVNNMDLRFTIPRQD